MTLCLCQTVLDAFVKQYWFHILDPEWGHLTIRISLYPPFGAQIFLNGHEYVARQAQRAGLDFEKENNLKNLIQSIFRNM